MRPRLFMKLVTFCVMVCVVALGAAAHGAESEESASGGIETGQATQSGNLDAVASIAARQLMARLYQLSPGLALTKDPIHLVVIFDLARETRNVAPDFAMMQGMYKRLVDDLLLEGNYITVLPYAYNNGARFVDAHRNQLVSSDKGNVYGLFDPESIVGKWDWYWAVTEAIKGLDKDIPTIILTFSNIGGCATRGDETIPRPQGFEETIEAFTGGLTDRVSKSWPYPRVDRNRPVQTREMCVQILMNRKAAAITPPPPPPPGEAFEVTISLDAKEPILVGDQIRLTAVLPQSLAEAQNEGQIHYEWNFGENARPLGRQDSPNQDVIYTKPGSYNPSVNAVWTKIDPGQNGVEITKEDNSTYRTVDVKAIDLKANPEMPKVQDEVEIRVVNLPVGDQVLWDRTRVGLRADESAANAGSTYEEVKSKRTAATTTLKFLKAGLFDITVLIQRPGGVVESDLDLTVVDEGSQRPPRPPKPGCGTGALWPLLFLILLALIIGFFAFFDLIPFLPARRSLEVLVLMGNYDYRLRMKLRGGRILIAGGAYQGKAGGVAMNVIRLQQGEFGKLEEEFAEIRRAFIPIVLERLSVPGLELIVANTSVTNVTIHGFFDYFSRNEVTTRLVFRLKHEDSPSREELELKSHIN